MDILNMLGNKYGELTAKRRSPKVFAKYGVHLICECSCGKTKEVAALHLRNGIVKSCGCLLRDPNKESMKKAVKAHTKNRIYNGLYNSWSGMKNRCNNVKHPDYEKYGERGITYDKRWEQFDAFKEDMGTSWFYGAEIDRIKNDENYSKDNCQWLDKVEHTLKTHEDTRARKLKE